MLKLIAFIIMNTIVKLLYNIYIINIDLKDIKNVYIFV